MLKVSLGPDERLQAGSLSFLSSPHQGCDTILYVCGGAQSKHDGLSMENVGDVGHDRIHVCMVRVVSMDGDCKRRE